MGAKVIGFISEKGGVGKTTACFHIAVGLNKFHRKKVLVIDTDYQRGGITCRLRPSMLEDFKKGKVGHNTLYNVFANLYAESDDKKDITILKGEIYKQIDLIPSDPRLSKISLDKLPRSNKIKEVSENQYKHLSAIKNTIDKMRENYDYILIDTHPEISDLLDSVIFACDYCVSPVKLDLQSSVGVPTAVKAINDVNENIVELLKISNKETEYIDTKFAGAIAMMAREYAGDLIYTMQIEYIKLRKVDGIFQNYLTEGDGIRVAAQKYKAVFDIDGNVAEKQSHQFKQIIKEFIERCKV